MSFQIVGSVMEKRVNGRASTGKLPSHSFVYLFIFSSDLFLTMFVPFHYTEKGKCLGQRRRVFLNLGLFFLPTTLRDRQEQYHFLNNTSAKVSLHIMSSMLSLTLNVHIQIVNIKFGEVRIYYCVKWKFRIFFFQGHILFHCIF